MDSKKSCISSVTIIAILLAVIGCNGVFSKDCNVTRRLAAEIFKKSAGEQNLTKTDGKLLVCSQNDSCCTRPLERQLMMVSEQIRVQMVSQLQGSIRQTFSNASQEFKAFFKSLIEKAYKNLDTLYSRTYLDKYTNNKAIFRHLFTKLGDYMITKEEMDLKQTVDSWFSLLYQKVYMISNPGFHFDASYQHCILETADLLMPFGDTPRKVSLQIKKSFLASRVLLDALDTAKKVVDELLKMKSHEKCSQAFMKMTQCPLCSGIDQNIKPCFNYCLNVMKGCSAYPSVVNPSWNAFITALHKLAIKADGPFSMEAIIEFLGVKISDGIMMFQVNRHNITAHVVRKCGNPPPTGLKSLKKRDLSDGMSYPYKFDTADGASRPNTAHGTNLYRLISKLKKTLAEVKDHWVSLPNNVCTGGVAAPRVETKRCWNGEAVDSYKRVVVKDGLDGMFKNPEVTLNKNEPHLMVRRQVISLQEMTQRILAAANGADSNQIDLEEGSGEGSGGGSGEGSGGSGEGSGVKPTSWVRTDPITRTEIIRTTPGNKIPIRTAKPTIDNNINNKVGGEDNDGQENQNSVELSKSVGQKPGNAASSVFRETQTFSMLICVVSLFSFMFLWQ